MWSARRLSYHTALPAAPALIKCASGCAVNTPDGTRQSAVDRERPCPAAVPRGKVVFAAGGRALADDELACPCRSTVCLSRLTPTCLKSSLLMFFLSTQQVRRYSLVTLSPIGRNSLFCCRRFSVRLSAIAHINKSFVWAHYHS